MEIDGGKPSGVDRRCKMTNIGLEMRDIGVNVSCVEGGEVELHAVELKTYGVRYVISVMPFQVFSKRQEVRTQVKIIAREDSQLIMFQGVFIKRD